ncbi:MAG: hypothetical protein K0R38_2770 [Polyangiaceae bacterium]|nr:hypothetical protein [Polyangiaceae bacterium]
MTLRTPARRMSWMFPSTTVSGLLKSCATPPASWPMASSLRAARSCSSSSCCRFSADTCSLTSRITKSTPSVPFARRTARAFASAKTLVPSGRASAKRNRGMCLPDFSSA